MTKMKVSSLTKVAAVLAVFGFVASASVAGATIADEAKCRKTISKSYTKLRATHGKNQSGCIKNVLKGKQTLAAGEKCHFPDVADAKGKAAKAAGKLSDSVGGAKDKCPVADHPLTLTGFGAQCQVPVSGALLPIADYGDVADCLESAAGGSMQILMGEVANPDYDGINASPNVKGLTKCITSIAKTVAKMASTWDKEKAKAQDSADKADATDTPSFTAGFAAGAKYTKAVGKLDTTVDKSCTPGEKTFDASEFPLLGSCGSTPADLKSCIDTAVQQNASGAVAMGYVSSGNCPIAAEVFINSGTVSGAGRRNRTALSAGFTGLGHNVDVIDGFEGQVDLVCDASCNCSVEASCAKGNCRCANSATTLCDEPFGPDADDCGGADCDLQFGPPLALSASGVPTCVVNRIDALSGSVDLSNGESNTDIANNSKVHTGISQSQPCPTCSGAAVGDIGTCDGGDRDTLACTTNGIHPTFGATSYDCPPAGAANISGSGLDLSIAVSDQPADLPFGVSCGGILAAEDCACRICTGGGNIPCNDNADCPGAETCTSNGAGVAQAQPNSCSDLTCTDGECAAGGSGDSPSFCNGLLRASGLGVITCSDNADCTALDPECPGGNCGDCDVVETRRCFNDPISVNALTNSGADHAVLGSTFCVSPTGAGSVDSAAGSPGPASLLLDFNFNILCPDGTTEYAYGGQNCP